MDGDRNHPCLRMPQIVCRNSYDFMNTSRKPPRLADPLITARYLYIAIMVVIFLQIVADLPHKNNHPLQG